MSDLVELQHEARRALLRMGIYKFNPNHDERGRFATGPHQGGRKASELNERGGGAGTDTERQQRGQAALKELQQHPSRRGLEFNQDNLNDFWDNGQARFGLLQRQELVGEWQAMEPCKQMRRAAAELVGLAKPPAADALRDAPTEWGGAASIDHVAAQEGALQILHQLHENGGELPVHGVLYRGSGADPAVIKQALKTGEQFDMPLASFAGAHPWLSTKYGGPDPESDAQRKATVIFQLNSPKAAIRVDGFPPAYTSRDQIPFEEYENGARVGDEMNLTSDNEDLGYGHMDAWYNQEHDQGEFISGGRFKVKSMKTKYVKGILRPGEKALVVELEHVGVFNPWTGEVE